jgi:tetratricopeptide (TPR) repeat protein
LKDVWVIITNTINLANVERDLGKPREALILYDRVAQIAQNSGLRMTEAIASRHAAQVHNQTRNFELAQNYANHAIGLLRDSAATVEFSIALEERGDAESGLGDEVSAAATFLEAAKVLEGADERERRARLISRAATEYAELDEPQRFFSDFGEFYSCSQQAIISTALGLAEKLSAELPSRYIFGALNIYFKFLFSDVPVAISRRLFRTVSKRILDASVHDSQRWLAFIPLIAATPADVLDLEMFVELADALHDTQGALRFKPSADLALNFVMTVDLGRPVLISVSQLDDKAETAAVVTIITMFLLGFQEEIRRRIFDASFPKRSEVNVNVIALSDAIAAKIPVSLDNDQNFGVTRPANFEEGLPTFALFRDGLLQTWEKEDYANGLVGLLATVLLEVTFQLFQAELDTDTLRRSIIRIVRTLI